MHKVEYAIYKGENMIATGTVDKIAEELGIAKKDIYAMAAPRAHKRDKGNAMVAVRINKE